MLRDTSVRFFPWFSVLCLAACGSASESGTALTKGGTAALETGENGKNSAGTEDDSSTGSGQLDSSAACSDLLAQMRALEEECKPACDAAGEDSSGRPCDHPSAADGLPEACESLRTLSEKYSAECSTPNDPMTKCCEVIAQEDCSSVDCRQVCPDVSPEKLPELARFCGQPPSTDGQPSECSVLQLALDICQNEGLCLERCSIIKQAFADACEASDFSCSSTGDSGSDDAQSASGSTNEDSTSSCDTSNADCGTGADPNGL